MTPSFLTLALVIAVAAFAPLPAAAEKADRMKPMNVEADALRYDDLRQTSVFTGRVLITKGTITIRGARVEVRQDPEGFQFGVVTAAPGQRAFWRQKRDGVDEYIEGEAETIEYDGRADRVKFISRAEMRRLRGTQVVDETSGSVITYENTTDTFTVDGAVEGARPNNPGGRVRAVIGPRETPAAPGAAAPATQAPAGGSAPLRPTPSLGAARGAGERR